MTVYWLLFAFFAVGTLAARKDLHLERTRLNLLYVLGGVLIAVCIGLRYKVGGDWSQYEFMYSQVEYMNLSEALAVGDPAYQAVNWFAYQIGGDIWLVNCICAAIFVWGLYKLCLTQPEPWAAALVSIPYLVIVVAMGYTRQAVALGILMAGLAAFLRGASPLRFAAYVAAAALFHKTAVVAFPLVALATERNRVLNVILVLALSVLLYDLFLGDAMDQFMEHYVRVRYSSQGAAIRIAMTMFAAGIFWVAGRRLQFVPLEQKLWRNFSIGAVLSVIFLVASPSSTAVDRVSLYMIPLQIAVLGRIALVTGTRFTGRLAVVSYCLIVQFVWLNYAQFASLWIPYRFFPIQQL